MEQRQPFVLRSWTMHELRNQQVSVDISSVRSKQLLCFVHGQGQKRKKKHTTKKFDEINNHSHFSHHLFGNFECSPGGLFNFSVEGS